MSRQDNIKKLLVNYNRRLQALQERKALYGLDTPIAILTEIEEIETQIEELQTELAELESKTNLPSQLNITPSGTVEDAGANKVAKISLTWLLWVGAGVLILVVGTGILVFLARGVNNSGDGATEAIMTAPETATVTDQRKNQAVQLPTASTKPVLTVDELEAGLHSANIVFSTGTDEDRARVRSYVTGPTSAYYLLAVNCLEVIGAQRFKKTEYLDMIDKWYTLQVGEGDYVAEDGQLHVEQLKAAIVQAHNEYYSDTATAFEELIEP